jgi:hypothetical protein
VLTFHIRVYLGEGDEDGGAEAPFGAHSAEVAAPAGGDVNAAGAAGLLPPVSNKVGMALARLWMAPTLAYRERLYSLSGGGGAAGAVWAATPLQRP